MRITERNGWKELSFTIPGKCEDENGGLVDNFRIPFLKADYRIRAKDDDEVDWYLLSEPKIARSGFSKNVSVKADHISRLLKTANLGLEFSDEEGNNVGTAEALLTTILKGTGWSVGHVDQFTEKRTGAIKVRSMKAAAKTGAFKLISQMCDLFEAKPVYHGDTRTVDIVAMNPFVEPAPGEPPVINPEKLNKVVELQYGHNLKNVQRTLNTENMVTKLYAYGAYGDKVSGYCGIDEWQHAEYRFHPNRDGIAGDEYCIRFTDGGRAYCKYFVVTESVSVSHQLVWSLLDPASMSYVWNETTQRAYRVTDEPQTEYVDIPDNLMINTLSPTPSKMPSFPDPNGGVQCAVGNLEPYNHGFKWAQLSPYEPGYRLYFPEISFGYTSGPKVSMLGLQAGHTYTMSFDYEILSNSGVNATTKMAADIDTGVSWISINQIFTFPRGIVSSGRGSFTF